MRKWLLAEVITDLPRWFFLLAWLTFYLATGAAVWYEFYLYPERPVLVNIKQGLVSAGGGLYPWQLAGLYLHLEVFHMILSRRANRLEVQRAAEEAAAAGKREAAAAKQAASEASKRAEAAEQAAAETVAAERAKMLEWYEQHKDHWPENLPPPPGIARNGADSNNGNP